MKEMLEKLKEWLKENQARYVEHLSWLGNTEGGFYSTDDFDFDKLCREIDAFGEELRKREGVHKSGGPQ